MSVKPSTAPTRPNPGGAGPSGADEQGTVGSSDFAVSKFYVYKGPSYYLDRQAVVFNLHIDPDGRPVEHYLPAIAARFPSVLDAAPTRVAHLFAETLLQLSRLEIGLHLNHYDLSRDGDEWVVAMEYLDADTVEDGAILTSEWLRALTGGDDFDFESGFAALKASFDRSLYGGPTAYSLIEAGLKRDIPVFYLEVEREMQWGYGRKQLRGRSTVLHTDSIKDTEFTTFKDDVKDFLTQLGMPTPGGATCADLAAALEEAATIGYPVVAKPVAGHKGEGVFTNLRDDAALAAAFAEIKAGLEGNDGPEGVIVERFITGFDHRLLTIKGKFAAALERVPAYVDGNGSASVQDLIAEQNRQPERASHARAPLARIDIDPDLENFLAGQDLSLASVPAAGRRIYLRRVANISAGGVSINVTERIHPDNVALCENIARFFQVTCLGIDVLAADISQSWRDSSFAIIEINAGPGVFMHLAPAIGQSIDVPGMVIASHFSGNRANSRIPIIAGHNLSLELCRMIEARLRAIRPDVELASVTGEGLHINGAFLCLNPHHDAMVALALRDPLLDFALFSHDKDAWLDYGSFHRGADIVVLNGPDAVEDYCLRRDLLADGWLVEIAADRLIVTRNQTEVAALPRPADPMALSAAIADLLAPLLPELLDRYGV